MARSPPGRTAPARSGYVRAQALHRLADLTSQSLELRAIRRHARSYQDVPPRAPSIERGKNLTPADLAEPPLQHITVDDPAAMLRHDYSESGPRGPRGRHVHIEARRALSLPLREQSTNLGAAVDPGPAGQALRSVGLGAYGFPAIFTAIRARPCRLRRLSVARPPFVAMRARNPCLFTRLRLRGLYVGFISGSPVHGSARPCEAKEELGKIG